MSLLSIECANCGAQYRLPPTFKADHAKCKKCGAQIDVKSQREAPAAESAPAPAAAAPSRPSSRRAAPSEDKPKRSAGSSRRSSRSAKKDDGGDDSKPSRGSRSGGRSSRSGGGRSSRSKGGSDKKNNNAMIMGGVIGLLAIAAVAFIFFTGGDDPENTENTAQAAEKNNTEATNPEATNDAGTTEDPGTEDPAPAETTTEDPAPAEQPEKPEEKPAPKPKAKTEITSPEDIFKPAEELEPLEWPDFVTPEQQAEIAEHLELIRDGGLGSNSAKTDLENMGAAALYGIVNELRSLDYLSWEDTMHGYELNRLLGTMSGGVNADFRSCDAGDQIPLENADWNGKTVKAWYRFVEKYGDPEALKSLQESRNSRNKVGR